MVKDKINSRATGKRSLLTRQTNQGRANDGGLRIGEMERDGIMANGMSAFLNDAYMTRGDAYYMAVCNKTGTISIYNQSQNLFLSPMADGPIKFNQTVDGEQVLNILTRFGRSFSLLRVPYAFKLMIQELQVMNIQMRLITEENVDQLMNLSYQSKNIDKLLHLEEGTGTGKDEIGKIIEQYKRELDQKISNSDLLINQKNYNKAPAEPNEPQSFEE